MPLEGHIAGSAIKLHNVKTERRFVFYDDPACVFVFFELDENAQRVLIIDDDIAREDRVDIDMGETLRELTLAVILKIDFGGFWGVKGDLALACGVCGIMDDGGDGSRTVDLVLKSAAPIVDADDGAELLRINGLPSAGCGGLREETSPRACECAAGACIQDGGTTRVTRADNTCARRIAVFAPNACCAKARLVRYANDTCADACACCNGVNAPNTIACGICVFTAEGAVGIGGCRLEGKRGCGGAETNGRTIVEKKGIAAGGSAREFDNEVGGAIDVGSACRAGGACRACRAC